MVQLINLEVYFVQDPLLDPEPVLYFGLQTPSLSIGQFVIQCNLNKHGCELHTCYDTIPDKGYHIEN